MKTSTTLLIVLGVVAAFGIGTMSWGDTQQDAGETSEVSIEQHTVDAQFSTPSPVEHEEEEPMEEVIVFNEKPEGEDVNWGYYGEFDVEEATDGLTEGDDYHVFDVSEETNVELDNPSAGEYHVYFGDDSDWVGHHDSFGTFEVPETVEELVVIQNEPIRLGNPIDVDEQGVELYDMGDFWEVTNVLMDEDGDMISGATEESYMVSLESPSGEEAERTVTTSTARTESGASSYFGELDVELGNDLVEEMDAEEVFNEVVVYVEVEGSVQHTEVAFEDGEKQFSGDDMSVQLSDYDNPVKIHEGDELTVRTEINYDADHFEAEATDANTLVDSTLDNVYGATNLVTQELTHN